MKLPTVSFALCLALAATVRANPIAAEIGEQARTPPSRIGVSLGLGGGVTNFTSSEMTSAVDVGGAYELRATFGTRLFLAGEVAYVGARRNVGLSGVSGAPGEAPHVFSNGVEGVLRAQYPSLKGKWLLAPFAFGGLGYTHYGVDGVVAAGSNLATSDDVLAVPFGAGVMAAWNGLVLEGRFTYRAIFDEDLVTRADGTAVSMDNWSAAALIGYEF